MTNAHYASIGQYRDVESLNYYRILCEAGKTPDEALEILAARSRDNGRTPVQWSAGPNAGFSANTPWILPPENYRQINAEAQMDDPDSIRSFYKQLVRLRKQRTVIARGQIEFVYRNDPDVLAYRRFDGAEELLVMCNLTGAPTPLERLPGWEGAARLLGNYPDEPGSALRPYECMVWEKRR